METGMRPLAAGTRTAARASAATSEPVPKLVTTSNAPPESPTTSDAMPVVPLLLRKRPSNRPAAEDPQPVPEHATVIAPTPEGRPASVEAENPAPTIGARVEAAVKLGLLVPET